MPLTSPAAGRKQKYLWITELVIFLTIAIITFRKGMVNEYSLLEGAQILILFMSCTVLICRYRNKQIALDMRQLALCLAFFALFMLLREMSWGRIFYYNEAHPITPEEKKAIKRLPHILALRYGMPLLAIYFLYYAIRRKLYRSILKVKVAAIDFLLILLGITGSILFDTLIHHEVGEELFELLFYLGVFNISVSKANCSPKSQEEPPSQLTS